MFTSNGNEYNAIISGKDPQVNKFIGLTHASKFKQSLTSKKNEGDLGKWMKEKHISLGNKDALVKLLTYKTPKKQKSVKKKAKYQDPRLDEYLDQKFWEGKRWTNYLEANARTNHHQRFGVEYEIKEIHISYGDKKEGKKFHNWARNCAHLLPIYTGKKDKGLAGKVEIHLDKTADPDEHGGVLLEVVTGQLTLGEMATVMEWFRNSLVAIETSEEYVAWLKHYFEPQKADIDLHEYIKRNLKLSASKVTKKWHSNPQVTTTLTAEELLSVKVMPNFATTFGGPVLQNTIKEYVDKHQTKNTEPTDKKKMSNKEKISKVGPGDIFIIQEYLGNMRMYLDQGTETEYKVDPSSTKGKGGRALIKHAAQQFESYSSNKDSIKNNPIVDRLDLYLETDYELLKLRTRANKIAPICKRPDGKIAYVIEYRGSSGNEQPDYQLGLWFEQGVKAKPLTEEMLRDTFFKNIIPKHKKAANTEDIEEKEDLLKLDDYAKICQALGKSSK